MASSFSLDGKIIGDKNPCFLIAEIGQAHDGSLGFAHSYIDAVADAGVEAIKFQTHIAKAESTADEKFRVNFSYEDRSRYEYWKRMEFTPEQWEGLYSHAKEKDLIFLSSAFSDEAVELLEKIGVPAWKVGSGEIGNDMLLANMVQTGKPILLSSGMSSWNEITKTIDKIKKNENPLALFQCTSKYPVSFEDVGLNVLDEMERRYNIPIGLSDHSGTIFPAMAAMAMGSDLIEVHVTFHKSMFGPDVPASISIEELKLLSQARDAFHKMRNHPVDKDSMADDMSEMRLLFNRSIALKKDYKKGTVLAKEMLAVKKPATGIPFKELDQCIGKVLKHDVSANYILRWSDLK